MTHPLFDLTGRRALITGSSQGIGLSYAEGLASAGATVVLNGRHRSKLDDAATALRDRGHAIEISAFDVTDPSDCETAVETIERDHGPIDILVNNVGMHRRERIDRLGVDDWRTVMEANLNSAFYVSRIVARHMIERGRGKIINTCSVMSMIGRPTTAAYTATKGGLAMLTKAMCVDWAELGLQANGIAPGYFETEMTEALVKDPEFSTWLKKRTPARRWGSVEELQGACIFLAADASNYVNGHILYVDGGMTSAV